jgi:Cu2+-exporting ATPase
MHYLLVFIGVITYLGTKLYDDIKTEVKSNPKGDENKQYMANVGTTIQKRYDIASTSLALVALGSLFFPVLIFISVAGIIYTTIPIWKNAIHGLKKPQFNMAVFDSLLFLLLLITRHYFILALLNWIYYLSKRFAYQVKYIEKIIRATQIYKKMPKVVWLLKDGVEIEVLCEELNIGDTIVINANEIIPVDGVIINGTTLIYQYIFTSELQPLQKTVGDQVFAATIVLSDRIYIRVGKSNSETLVTQK